VNDTVMLDLESGKVKDFIKFDLGNMAMATGGHNNGRVGTIVHREKHKGSFDIVHIKDAGAWRLRPGLGLGSAWPAGSASHACPPALVAAWLLACVVHAQTLFWGDSLVWAPAV
jgi:hypothetical protein